MSEIINYKGMEFKVTEQQGKYAAYFNFAGGCELAGSRGKTLDECLIRTTSVLNNAFLQPAVVSPRVGDLLDDGTDDRLIVVNVDVTKLTAIPLKDAKITREVVISDNTAFPYLSVTNKVEDFTNEITIEFPRYVILEDGVLHTNNFPMDVFVWKGKLDEE